MNRTAGNQEKPLTKFPAILLARLNSNRLPMKALREIKGKKLIQYVIDALQECKGVSEVIIATSSLPSDDDLVLYAKTQNIRTYRGSLDNVAFRLLEAGKIIESEAVFRVNGDSPFISTHLLEQAACIFSSELIPPDVVTNISPRTYPSGQSVELINVETFRNAYSNFNLTDKEHVTPYFYRNSKDFRIINIEGLRDRSGCSLAIDTKEDFDRACYIIERMDRPHYKYSTEEILELLEGEDKI